MIILVRIKRLVTVKNEDLKLNLRCLNKLDISTFLNSCVPRNLALWPLQSQCQIHNIQKLAKALPTCRMAAIFNYSCSACATRCQVHWAIILSASSLVISVPSTNTKYICYNPNASSVMNLLIWSQHRPQTHGYPGPLERAFTNEQEMSLYNRCVGGPGARASPHSRPAVRSRWNAVASEGGGTNAHTYTHTHERRSRSNPQWFMWSNAVSLSVVPWRGRE